MKELTKQDLYDLLYGCTILGTGGGGDLEEGLNLIDEAFAAGKSFKIVNLDEVPDEGYIAVPYMCGSISPMSEEEEEKYAHLPEIKEKMTLKAFKNLEDYLGKNFYGVMSTELGGANTAQALYVGAMLGINIVDADAAGRSVPELQHSTFYINNVPINPLAISNEFGDLGILNEVVDDFRAEELVRAMAVASKNSVGVADHPIQGKDLKNSVIPGALSYALKIGKAYRKACEGGKDLADEIANAGNGFVLFRGEVENYEWEDKDGFTVGNVYINGTREYEGSKYKIWFKNEHIISWRDNEYDVTVPDLICIVNDETKEPVTNPYYKKGMKVSVFGLPSPEEWTTARGMEVFGPESFGFSVEYTPLKKVVSKKG